MEASGLKNEDVRENELEIFCESLVGNIVTKYEFTIDYFDASVGLVNGKENPTSLNFCVALLREILCNLKPSHELWDKIKYATFLLHVVATRPHVDFTVLYSIFHQVEIKVKTKQWSWREAKVKSYLAERITEKIIVKDDVCSLPDLNDDIKRDIDYDDVNEDNFEQFMTTNDDNNHHIDNDDHENDFDDKDENLAFGMDELNEETNYDDNTKDERLSTKYEEDFENQDVPTIHKKVKLKKIKEDKSKKKRKRKTEEEKELQPKVKKKRGRPKKEVAYFEDNNDADSDEKSKMLRCHLCTFKAKSGIGLERHAFEKHEANRLCTQCGHLSDTFKDYIAHEGSHVYNCEVCSKSVMGRKNLQVHMKLHDETKKEEDLVKEISKIPCDICGQLLRENSIYSHMRFVHGSELVKCDLCDFSTNAKFKLTIHRRLHFKKAAECPDCGKVVKNLKRHRLRKCGDSKEEKERFPCHLCNKTFAFKEGLDRHIKHIHQKIMNFHCEQCDYRTYSGFNLRLHVSKMHTKEEMERICQFCNQKTKGLDHHIRIYHADDLYKYNQQQESATNNKQESQDDQQQLMSPHNNQQISHQDQSPNKSQQQILAAQFNSQIPPLIRKQEKAPLNLK
eukprot:TRINITY_DN12315_c0_g1_i7.p1 TRINITY_DN12315_c0_g1~~TRINITY_DN12315_c0_g1_i7.p1  ORF type:complete len:621 (+),score=125.13 TRINITY_DN12315_c0_g1_i7:73-1935(+)